MFNKFVIVFAIITSLNSYAQYDSTKIVLRVPSDLKLSYNSAMKYPGARVGLEIPIRLVQKTKIKNSGYQKVIYKGYYLTGNLNWYHHMSYHDNIYFTLEGGYRRTRDYGFFFDFSSGWGYSRTFLGATTYTVDDYGNAAIKRYAGYNYALFIMSAGFGYDFSKIHSLPFSIFSKFSILTMYPYNSTFYLRPTIEFGIIYYPVKFMAVKTKIKSIVKHK
jgi:hypothetical protein